MAVLAQLERAFRGAARAFAVLLVLLPALLILALSFGAVVRFAEVIRRDAARIVSSAASDYLGTRVTVARLDLSPSLVRLAGVRVADPSPRRGVSGNASLIEAATIEVPVEAGLMSRWNNPDLPLVSRITLHGVVLRLHRDAQGRWNVARLMRPEAGPPTRVWVGQVDVTDARVEVDDEALHRHAHRPPEPVSARVERCRGRLIWRNAIEVMWSFHGVGTSPSVAQARLTGRYNGGDGGLFLAAQLSDARVPDWANRFLPRGYQIVGGRFSGVSVVTNQAVGTPVAGGASGAYRFIAHVWPTDVVLQLPYVRGPLTVSSGDVRVQNEGLEGSVVAELAGETARVTGHVSFDRPVRYDVAGDVRTVRPRVLVQRLPWLPTAVRSLAEVTRRTATQISSTVRVRGTGNRAIVSVQGAVRSRGTVNGDLTFLRPAHGSFEVLGPANNPSVRFDVNASEVNVRGLSLRRLRARLDGSASRLEVTCQVPVGDGQILAVGHLRPSGDRWSYGADLFGRKLRMEQLLQMVKRMRVPGLARPLVGEDVQLGGEMQFDAAVRGTWGSEPTADVLVQVFAPILNKVELDRAELRGIYANGWLELGRVLVERGAAVAVAQGTVDTRTGETSVGFEADAWPIAYLLDWAGATPSEAVGGVLKVRAARLAGDIREPHIEGSVHVDMPRYGDWAADRADFYVSGTRSSVYVDGEIARVPGVSTIQAVVRRPWTPTPWLTALADLNGFDAQDVLDAAQVQADVSGLFSATAVAHGPLSSLTLNEWSVQAESLWAGDVKLANLAASGSAAWQDDGPRFDVEHFTAQAGDGRVTGRARTLGDGRFHLNARLSDVPLDRFASYWAKYAAITGTVSGEADLLGTYRNGEPFQLTGTATFQSSGFSVNGETLGEVWGRVKFQDGYVVGDTAGQAQAVAGWGTEGRGLTLQSFRASLDGKEFEAMAQVRDVSVEAARRALERSPVVANEPPEGRLRTALATLVPVKGTLSGEATGKAGDGQWSAEARVRSESLELGQLPIADLECAVKADQNRLDLQALNLSAQDAYLSASGQLVYGESVQATLSAQGLELSTLARWLPATSPLHGLRGSVDAATAEVRGRPEAPEVTLVANARAISWMPPAAEAPAAPNLAVPAARVSGVVREGEVVCEDLAILLSGVPRAEQAPLSPLEIHLEGRMPFSWKQPSPRDDTPFQATVRLPEQRLDVLNSLMAQSLLTLEGHMQGDVTLKGSVGTLRKLAQGEAVPSTDIRVEGVARLEAQRIGVVGMRTSVTDVQLAASLDGEYLTVKPLRESEPVARIQVAPDRGVPTGLLTTGDVYVSGRLPIAGTGDASDVLRIMASRIPFYESPLPGFDSGRLAGELSSRYGQPGLRLAVSGSLLEPFVRGRLTVRNTALRLPATELHAPPRRVVGLIDPRFDVELAVEDNVTVTNALMVASLYTEAGQPVRLGGTLSAPELDGRMVVAGGKLIFPTARFTILRGGNVSIRYPVATYLFARDGADLEVNVDLQATAYVSATSVTGARRRYKLTVHAQGPLTGLAPESEQVVGRRLQLTYRSEPPDLALSQSGLAQRVTALLGGQEAIEAVFSRGGATGGKLVGQAGELVGGVLIADVLEGTGLQEALGLQELTVDYSAAGTLTLRLSRMLYGPFEATYWRRIAGGTETVGDVGAWELRLGMRIRDAFRLSYGLDSQRTNAFRLEGVFSF